MHDGEDTLLHFTGILRTQNDHFMATKMDGDTRGTGHAQRITILQQDLHRMMTIERTAGNWPAL